jgi:Glu-tRNA(Gln) amidotransferase subunit E-like FAD-binding protein
MDTVKQLWSKFTGKTDTDEIDEVLKEQSTQSGIQELLETLKETRIFKLGMEVMENLNIEKLGLDSIDFSNIENLIEMVKNPEHPVTKKAIQSVQGLIEDRMKKGSLRREDFIAEIEMLKEKFKHSLGKLFKSELFGDTSTREVQTAQTLMSNHPDARRARMLARLQRKLGK